MQQVLRDWRPESCPSRRASPQVRCAAVGLALGIVTAVLTSCASHEAPAERRIAILPGSARGSQFVPSSLPSSSPAAATPTDEQLDRVRALVTRLGDDRSAGFFLDRDSRIVIQVTDRRAVAEVVSANIPGVVAHLAARSQAELQVAESNVQRLGAIAGTSFGIDESANRVVVEADDQVSDRDYERLRRQASRSDGAIAVHRIGGKITMD